MLTILRRAGHSRQGWQIAMSGQAFEAQAVVRLAIEGAWYVLHIAADPVPSSRANLWRRRGTSPQATQKCKNEFTVGNVRRTHERLDARSAAGMCRLYEDTIEFGGHPNQVGIGGSARIDRSGSVDVIQVGVLTPGTLATGLALKAAVEAAVGALRTFRLAFPERFEIMGLDRDVEKLVHEHNAVFMPAKA